MRLGKSDISDNNIYIVAEIGINHNGSIELAKAMINIAKKAGCHAVKFQKRTIDDVYTKEELDKQRESIFGNTNRDLKNGLEFNIEQYKEIVNYCNKIEIDFFASPWDCKSVDFLENCNICCYKIASACITDINLLEKIKQTEKPVIISTGMSSINEIRKAVDIFDKDNVILLSCTSTYPNKDEEINLNKIKTLKKLFPGYLIGYSGHEEDILPSIIAASFGCVMIERHITLSKLLWGSDQMASLEPSQLNELVNSMKRVKLLLGKGEIGIIENELPIKEKLRKY